MREETLAILHETRATCIVVTHDAEEAMRMGDRVVLLRKRGVVQLGSALDLYRAPKDILAARTFSDLNEVPARVKQGSAKTAARQLPCQWRRRRQGGDRLRAPARCAFA
jgi:iron(III) transport system ATP-binding protein